MAPVYPGVLFFNASGLSCTCETRLKKLASYKRSSLLVRNFSDEKKFYKIDIWKMIYFCGSRLDLFETQRFKIFNRNFYTSGKPY